MCINSTVELFCAVSACLLGYACRYDGIGIKNNLLINNLKDANIIPVCPEVFSGLPVPRPHCVFRGGDGNDVLNGRALVMDCNGKDCTSFFIKGAYITLEIVKKNEITKCFMKSKSPSCGSGLLALRKRRYSCYSGISVAKGYRKVLGVTAALLLSEGVEIEEIL